MRLFSFVFPSSLVLIKRVVWERIKRERTSGLFKADQDEEYEDAVGNVFNRKTYEDLRRQGLL